MKITIVIRKEGDNRVALFKSIKGYVKALSKRMGFDFDIVISE